MGSVLSLFASRHSLTTSISRKSLTTMSQERVKSKNLFNFRSQGFIDPEVVLYDEKMKKEMGLDPVAMEEQMLSQTETEFAGGMRAMMDGMLGQTPFATDPAYIEAYASCDNTVLEVPTKHDMYITPATRFAHKLRTAGRLLEFVCIPGAKHGSGMMPSFRALWKLAREAWRVAIQEYLVKN